MGQDIEDETTPDIPVHTFRDSSTGSYENDMRGRGASGGSVVIILPQAETKGFSGGQQRET